MKRLLLGAILALCLVVLGFTAIAGDSAAFRVPRNQGLAGGAIVLDYGLPGALAGLAIGVWVAWRMPARRLAALNFVAFVLAAAAPGSLLWQAQQRNAKRIIDASKTTPEALPKSTAPTQRP